MSSDNKKFAENSAAKNRAAFPETAKIVDMFRASFGSGVKLIGSTLDGKLIGKIPPPPSKFVTAEHWLWQTKALVEPELLRRASKPMLPNIVGKGKRR